MASPLRDYEYKRCVEVTKVRVSVSVRIISAQQQQPFINEQEQEQEHMQACTSHITMIERLTVTVADTEPEKGAEDHSSGGND